jgi:polyisoprenoid-binding protein YceI
MATLETTRETTAQSTWTIDPAHTLVEFSAKHLMITTVRGGFSEVAGTIVVNEANPSQSSVEVDIAAASIDTRVDQRDAHLRSADFLHVENFPKITFRSRRIEGAPDVEGNRFRIVGDLTIRGTTREVALDVTYDGRREDPWGGERIGFSADTRIDRRDFGLTWNQALEAGGVVVGNDIRIHLEVQAVRA